MLIKFRKTLTNVVKNCASGLALGSLLLFFICPAQATLIGPVYPLLDGTHGGWTGGNGGLPGNTGGLTWSYGGFNLGLFSDLYWAPTTVEVSLDGGLYTVPLTYFPSLSSATAAVYGGSTQYAYANTFVNTQFTLTNPEGWLVDGTLSGMPGAAVDIAGDFSVNLLVEAYYQGPGYQPVNTLLQNANNLTLVNIAGGFYYETAQAPVPEPTTMILFGAGLVGLAAVRKRRKAC